MSAWRQSGGDAKDTAEMWIKDLAMDYRNKV